MCACPRVHAPQQAAVLLAGGPFLKMSSHGRTSLTFHRTHPSSSLDAGGRVGERACPPPSARQRARAFASEAVTWLRGGAEARPPACRVFA